MPSYKIKRQAESDELNTRFFASQLRRQRRPLKLRMVNLDRAASRLKLSRSLAALGIVVPLVSGRRGQELLRRRSLDLLDVN